MAIDPVAAYYSRRLFMAGEGRREVTRRLAEKFPHRSAEVRRESMIAGEEIGLAASRAGRLRPEKPISSSRPPEIEGRGIVRAEMLVEWTTPEGGRERFTVRVDASGDDPIRQIREEAEQAAREQRDRGAHYGRGEGYSITQVSFIGVWRI